MAEKKEDFVVSDRRRFAPEGEVRPDVSPTEEEQTPAAAAPETPSQVAAPSSEEMPEPPTESEQQTQHEEYKASGKKIDDMIRQAGGGPAGASAPVEMTFERLVESFYMTALIQLGAVRPEGEAPRVDILGARQTIDSLTIISDKTKGNLSAKEQTMLHNVLFELRMAWIEITNAIAKGPAPQPGAGKK